jgi:cell wall-associated NlpC family hydrolase
MDRLLGPLLTEAERAAVLAEAERLRLLPLPWRHQGCTERGADCRGFLWLAIARGLRATRGALQKPRADYGLTPFNGKLRAGLVEWLGEPIKGDPQPGDIVTMHWTGDAHHVAMVTTHPHYGLGLIHADNTAAGGPRVVAHGWDPEVWERRFIEGFRP